MELPVLAREIRIFDRVGGRVDPADLGATRVLIYGAGGRGRSVLHLLRRCADPKTRVVAFADKVSAPPVLGLEVIPADDLPARREHFDLVLIASHWAGEIAARLEAMGIPEYCTARHLSEYDPLDALRAFYPDPAGLELVTLKRSGESLQLLLRAEDGAELETVSTATSGHKEIPCEAGWLRIPLPATGRRLEVRLRERGSGEVRTLQLQQALSHGHVLRHFLLGRELHHRRSARVESWAWKSPDKTTAAAFRALSHPAPEPVDDLDAAWSLARGLLDDLEEHRGLPEHPERPPLELYREALNGQEYLDCGAISRIFRDLCAAHNIACRMVHLTGPQLEDVRITPGHCCNEVYCRERKQWVFMDLYFQLLGAVLPGDILLSYLEFQAMLSTPRRAALRPVLHATPERRCGCWEKVLACHRNPMHAVFIHPSESQGDPK
ncbi:MAG: nucleoside-diphosphate sugar epimerase/dehydratase [Desulfovibrio sp.]